MTAPRTLLRIRAALLAGVCGVLFAGCGGPSWREEVITSTGEHMVVQRQVIEGSRFDQEISNIRFGPPTRGNVLRAPLADGTWTQRWEAMGLNPQAIGRVEGSLYLSATLMGCQAYDDWGRPVPPYVFFRYANSGWERITADQFPASITRRNLIYASSHVLNSIGGTRYISSEQAKLMNPGLPTDVNEIFRSQPVFEWDDCRKRLEVLDRRRRSSP